MTMTMTRKTRLIHGRFQWALLAALASLPACQDDAKKDASAENDGAADRDTKTAKKGLGHADNDESVVELATAASKCAWNEGLSTSCEAFAAWKEANHLFQAGKNDPTLLNMIEDDAAPVRWLAAKRLDDSGAKWRKDPPAAERVLAAAEREKDDTVATALGRAVGAIDVAATGLGEPVKDLLTKSGSPKLREAIAGSVLFNNRKEASFYDLLQKMAREEKDENVRKAAAAAFWTGGSERHDETCKLWLELADDADSDLAGHAAYHAAWWSSDGGCTGQWDALLDTIERKAKAGEVASTFMTSALGWLQKQKKASTAQKKRALDIAETVVANTSNPAMARGDALRVLGENDPRAKTFAARYEDDPEGFVKSTAKSILEGTVEPRP